MMDAAAPANFDVKNGHSLQDRRDPDRRHGIGDLFHGRFHTAAGNAALEEAFSRARSEPNCPVQQVDHRFGPVCTFQGRPTRRCQRPLSLALAFTQGVPLCLVQSLRDVRDQIGRVFDADRQPYRGVENAYFLADVSRNAGVGHACGQAGWQATECRPGSPPA